MDIDSRKPRLATVTGGYSGPPIKPVALAKVFEAHKAVSIPIIGIGGIANVTDVIEFMVTGACAVQVGTANFVNPLSSVEIIDDLNKAAEKYPEESSIVQTLGDAYFRANKLEEALEAFTKAQNLLH